jgi:hypothetical protein
MRLLAALFAACLVAGCGSDRTPDSLPQASSPAPATAAPAPQGSPDPAVHSLLAASARDFHAHQPPYPARFRQVRAGHTIAPDGKKEYLVRGQFLPTKGQVEPEWTTFVTIKTSDYEQLLGLQADGFCKQPSIVWDDKEDLSSTLQSQLDSLR